jgi:hypothetical protein
MLFNDLLLCRSVKKTGDSIGFLLISLATFYIGYKNITYKGPGYVLYSRTYKSLILSYWLIIFVEFWQRIGTVFQRISRGEQ